MELKDILQEYKNKSGYSDAEIARRLHVDRSTVARWSTGKVKRVSSEMLEKLSNLIGYPLEPLLNGIDLHITLPVLGYVKAGYDLFAEENYLGEEDATLDEKKKGDYYLQVSGNSMIGVGIMDSSYVLVQQCNTLQSGEIGVVLVGEEVTVKRVILKKDMLILEAANPEVANRYYTSEDIKNLPIRVIGKVLSCKTYF